VGQDEFDIIESAFGPYLTGNRTRSTALLAWFLEHVWRLEPEDVDDAICDGGGDKGIDAMYVDEDLREITIFQAKCRDASNKTQGDSDLKTLVGSAIYFESPEKIDALLDSGPNAELVSLVGRLKIRERVAEGAHAARLVFVTNGELDVSGKDYVAAHDGSEPPLDVWDQPRIAAVAVRTQRPELLPDLVELTAVAPPATKDLDGNTTLAVGLVPATELVTKLPGIADLSIFDPNVRLGLGRTRINRELAKTVTTPEEHALFPAYHNGLTVLTNKLSVQENLLTLEGVSVVNGCQSLLTLHDNATALTDELTILVKAIQVDTAGDLPDKITYRTNNQNSVDIRDQRSRDRIQRDLQASVHETFGNAFGFSIRRGERLDAAELFSNESAAQMIMAVYLREPWNAVRKVRLFDADYHRIFNKSITAHRLYLLHLITEAVNTARDALRPDLASSFSSVRFTLAALLADVLRESAQGLVLLDEPQRYLPDLRDEVLAALVALAREVAESTNNHVANEESEASENGEIYDPKVAFKSKPGVQKLENEVIRMSKRLAQRDETYFFQIDPAR
jgi:hypothetical protein